VLTGVAVETLHVDLVVKVTDVADDGVVLELGHVLGHDDVLVAGGGDDDVDGGDDILEGDDGETLHVGLEGADGVDLRDEDLSTSGLHGLGTALADITEASDEDLLTGDHDISGAHDAIGERVAATAVFRE